MNCVYIVECSDHSLYTGWTNDLEKRLQAHNSGKGCKYTRVRYPVHLRYVEFFETKSEATSREYAIKKFSRAKKLEIIGSDKNKIDALEGEIG